MMKHSKQNFSLGKEATSASLMMFSQCYDLSLSIITDGYSNVCANEGKLCYLEMVTMGKCCLDEQC